MFDTVIRFSVSVPVLSVQITPVAPRVSTTSRFFTNTRLSASFLQARDRHEVTVTGSPWGT